MRIGSVFFSFIVTLSALIVFTTHAVYQFPYTDHLKQSFEDTFHERCDKYAFVRKYLDLLENPNGRYFMFVMQQPNLKNGGLGDRLAGLLSSVAMSLRFNRTLLIRSHNYMYFYWRPFHPIDIHATEPKYTWENWLTWSGYNMQWADHDATEYDLYDCINNTGIKSDHCSMEGGDAGTPTILYRSNRCYLCRFDNGGHGVGQDELRKNLGIAPGEDLYEVAGCMMRLAIWPTENLWKLLDQYYVDATHHLGFYYPEIDGQIVPSSSARRKRRTKERKTSLRIQVQTNSSDHNDDKNSNIYKKTAKNSPTSTLPTMLESLLSPLSFFSSFSSSSEKVRKLSSELGSTFAIKGEDSYPKNPTTTSTATIIPTASPTIITRSNPEEKKSSSGNTSNQTVKKEKIGGSKSVRVEPFYQLGVHFRCGDISFFHQGAQSGCEFTEGMPASSYMLAGNPVQLGECLTSSVRNHTVHLMGEHSRIMTPTQLLTIAQQARERNESMSVARLTAEGQFLLVYITSDSAYSSAQIQRTMQYNHSIVGPPGCHVEVDSSLQCLELTILQWFVLAQSTHIAIQTEGEVGTPVSAYSRYAGIYRLKPTGLLNGRNCDASATHAQLSHLQQGNWFC